MGSGKEDGRGGREGEGDEERGQRERDGRRGRDAVTRRKEENRDVGTARRWGRIRCRGLRPGSRGAEEARRALGGPRHPARVGAGVPRTEGRGLGLPRGGRGRGGERRRGEGARGRGGEARILCGAAVQEAAPRRWRRRTDRPTARAARTDGRLPGTDRGSGDSGGGRCAAPGPVRAGAARGADRGRTAPQDRAREPAPRGGQCPRPPGPSGRARPAPRALPGGGGGRGAGGFVLSRRQWGRGGGLGLREEGERERERGGRA